MASPDSNSPSTSAASALVGTNLSQILASEVFEVTAGNGETRLYVHKEVLISQSEPLRNAITGGWKETNERKLKLDDWDGATVVRLIEYLYTGDYRYPDPFPSGEGVEGRGAVNQEPKPCIKRREGASISPTRPLTPLNECLDIVFPQDHENAADWAKLALFHPHDDYKEVLLCHAKLYAFSQFYSIIGLRTLALRRLLLVLLKVNPLNQESDSRPARNFVDLTTYVYANTGSLVSSEEPLRKLVTQFAALNILALQTRQEMRDLMSQGGDFVTELLPKISRASLGGPKRQVTEKIKDPDLVPNPTMGSFNTEEVHHWRHAWVRTPKTASFDITYSTPPGIPVGINRMDLGKDRNIRINAYASSIGRDRLTINIDTWLDTQLYSARCAWLQVASDDQNFQFGRYSTDQDRRHNSTCNSRLISFPRAYAVPPIVVVMLAGLDMEHHKCTRVMTYVTDVTEASFVIHIDTWRDSILHWAAATWIAYPAGIPNVASGRFHSTDVRPSHPPQLNTVGHVTFSNGLFTTPPRVLLAFNYLDMECRRKQLVAADYWNVTKAGMTWNLSTWEEGILFAAGASYIALA